MGMLDWSKAFRVEDAMKEVATIGTEKLIKYCKYCGNKLERDEFTSKPCISCYTKWEANIPTKPAGNE